MRWLIAAVVAVVLVAGSGGVGAYLWWTAQVEEDRAVAAAEAFVSAWEVGDEDALVDATGGDEEAAAAHIGARERLDPEEVAVSLRDVDVGRVREGRAAAICEVRWELGEVLGTWTHRAELRLRRRGDGWTVAWTPTALHAELETGQTLGRVREWPERAPITDADGRVLVGPGEVAEVGVEPRAVEDPAEVADRIAEHTAAAPEDVLELLDRDDLEPDWFYPVAELAPDGDRGDVAGVAGVVVRETTSREVAEPALEGLLGRVGEITAERLEELGAPYDVGDVVGLSGVERAYERELAGEPRSAVRVVDEDGEPVRVLHETEPVDPEPVAVTLDADVQRAADAAMNRVGGAGALVAVDADSGGVLAAVDRPPEGFPRWRAGGYAPGSTFKVVTAAALLADGLTPDSTVDCPATITVMGRSFRNVGGLELGEITFTEAFAESCNTAFISAAQQLPSGALEEAAARFGFGENYAVLGTPVAAVFPEPADDAEHAAQAIGQGRSNVAPAHMAGVAAAAASGRWRAPHLRVDEDAAAGEPLGQRTVDALDSLQRAVITEGTGTAADVDDVPVRGKTGTAEFGEGGEHAWFIGHARGVAFAVLVEDGGSGGRVAAPIAAEFVAALR
jgi:cell division protein FtsI/penicillin-binding protein 2